MFTSQRWMTVVVFTVSCILLSPNVG